MRHARNLIQLEAGEVIAFDPRPDRRAAAEKEGARVVVQLDDAWAARPDVAVIATPTSTHVPLALEAATHGCHLFIEKPLGNSLESTTKLLDEVRRRGLVTLVGCNMRFHPGIMAVKRIMDEGGIGRVLSARFEAGKYLPEWHPWEDYRHGYSASRELGGGIILDAIHELDYASWLLGRVEGVACFADHVSRLEIETEDVAAILLRFASGAIGEVHLDYVQRTPSRGCKLIGEEGTIEWSGSANAVRVYHAGGARPGWIEEPLPEWEPNEMYLAETRHLLRCLDGDERPELDVVGGLAVLRVALAALRSAQEQFGIDPVALVEDDA